MESFLDKTRMMHLSDLGASMQSYACTISSKLPCRLMRGMNRVHVK